MAGPEAWSASGGCQSLVMGRRSGWGVQVPGRTRFHSGPDSGKVAGMTDRAPLHIVPPLPSAIVEDDGLPTVERFGELVAEHSDTGRTDWLPRSVMVAEWTARRLVEARATIAQRDEEAAAWHAQIDEWYASVTGEAQSIVAFAEAALKAFALAERELTKRPTLKLPSMVVRTKSNPRCLVVIDEEAFVTWAVVHRPELIRTKHESIAAEVKALSVVFVEPESAGDAVAVDLVAVDKATGEIIPGLGWRAETITANL